jgi:hypothetical protein
MYRHTSFLALYKYLYRSSTVPLPVLHGRRRRWHPFWQAILSLLLYISPRTTSPRQTTCLDGWLFVRCPTFSDALNRDPLVSCGRIIHHDSRASRKGGAKAKTEKPSQGRRKRIRDRRIRAKGVTPDSRLPLPVSAPIQTSAFVTAASWRPTRDESEPHERVVLFAGHRARANKLGVVRERTPLARERIAIIAWRSSQISKCSQ